MKRHITLLGIAALIFAVAGCAPPPDAESVLTCNGIDATARLTPGVTFDPQLQRFDLEEGSGLVDCSDTKGLGITSGTFDAFSAVFPSLDCFGTGAQGVGAGNVTWSDGSSSALISRSIEMQGPLTARINIQVIGGQFDGLEGGITVEATPVAGDCDAGITQELLSGGVLTLS